MDKLQAFCSFLFHLESSVYYINFVGVLRVVTTIPIIYI